TAQDTLIAPFNDLDAVSALAENNPGNIAAVILEPVVGNMGCVPPQPGYLQGLRDICTRHGILLIFDEVMTGFRLAPGGAQELYNLTPDLTTLGKIIGGGLPVGAYGGRREIMDFISPAGPIYQAGTLSGNPLAMAAGLALLRELKANPAVYDDINKVSSFLADSLAKQLSGKGIPCTVNQVGSMLTVFFTSGPVTDLASAKKSDTALFG